MNPPSDAVARRIFDMVLQGRSILDVTKTLNAEGIPTTNGKKWLKTTVHTVLSNEAYTGTVGLGSQRPRTERRPCASRTHTPPSSPSGSSRRARRTARVPRPEEGEPPPRSSSPYLLSGLAKCETCGKAMTAAEAKSGKYTYYICHSLLKRGKGTCKTPRLNAKKFETLIVDEIRANILTESNIRDLVKLLDEEMDGVAHEQRERLETIDGELEDVKKQLGRVWHFIARSDSVDVAEASDLIVELRERKEKLEIAAEEARGLLLGAAAVPGQRRHHRHLRRRDERLPQDQRADRDQGLRPLLRQGGRGQARQGRHRLLHPHFSIDTKGSGTRGRWI